MYEQESYEIIGSALKVHNTLGCGFSEKVYQDALEVELKFRNIPFLREHPYKVIYNGVMLKSEFVPDFVCYDKIVVELKAVKEIDDIFKAQAINYGRVAGFKLALLINFGRDSLEYHYFPIKSNI